VLLGSSPRSSRKAGWTCGHGRPAGPDRPAAGAGPGRPDRVHASPPALGVQLQCERVRHV